MTTKRKYVYSLTVGTAIYQQTTLPKSIVHDENAYMALKIMNYYLKCTALLL